MASFVAPVPASGFWSACPNFSNSLSRRRPRYHVTLCPSRHNPNRPAINREFPTHFICSMASPGMSQSKDDKQENKQENTEENKQKHKHRHRHRARKSKQNVEKRNLEMGWQFQMRRNEKPVTCVTCNGTGNVECDWCHATGVLMLGDRLMCSLEGRSQCLACDNGEVKCKQCKGTGRIAPWMVANDV